jgi:hypothetical protein
MINSNSKGKLISCYDVSRLDIDILPDTMASSSKAVTQVHSHRTSSLSKAHTQPTNIPKANSITRSMASQVRQVTDQATQTPRLRATEA